MPSRESELIAQWEKRGDHADEKASPYDNGAGRAVCNAYHQCAEELGELTKWIPITERMPEKDGRYEVWQSLSRGAMGVNICAWGTGFSGVTGWLFGAVASTDHLGITHWRELPEGPKP